MIRPALLLNTVGGGNLEPKITIDGTIGPHETDRITNKDGMVQTLKATDYKNPPKIVIDGLTRDTQKQKAGIQSKRFIRDYYRYRL